MKTGPLWLVAGAAFLARLPAFFASRHLSFDDGVYGASALAMRDGNVPFQDVFSSQGPLHLPLVWLADLAGFRTQDAPRLLAVAAGLALVFATWSLARSAGAGPGPALGAAALTGLSGSVLWVSGPLTSDGPALALATSAMAVAMAWLRRRTLALAVGAGLLVGAALSVKSLLIAVAVPVGLALWAQWRHLAAAAGAALVVGLSTTLAFGFSAVWDQSVAYHLDAAGQRTPAANAAKMLSTLSDRDLPLVVAALAVAGGLVLGLRRPVDRPDQEARPRAANDRVTTSRHDPDGPEPDGPEPDRSERDRSDRRPAGLVGLWLGLTVAVLLVEHPLWRNHVAHLVPAAAVLVAVAAGRLRPLPVWVLAGAVATVGAVHVTRVDGLLRPGPPRGDEAAARRAIGALPDGAWAISDEPGLVWREGVRTPADLVDTSVLRIEQGRITEDSLVEDASDPRVCAVVVWSDRFGRFEGLAERLGDAGFTDVTDLGPPRRVYLRPRC